MLRSDPAVHPDDQPSPYRREPPWYVWLILMVAALGAVLSLGGRLLDDYTSSKDAEVKQLNEQNRTLRVQVAAARLGQDCTLDYIEQIARAVPTLALPHDRPTTCPPPLSAKERARLQRVLEGAAAPP